MRGLVMVAGSPSAIYDHPFLYELALGGSLSRQVDFLEAVFDRHADLAVRRVVEFGCGTGRYLRALSRRGYRTEGVDASPAMIEFGSFLSRGMENLPTFHVGDMTQWSTPGFDAALCMASTLRYLTDASDLKAHFRRAAESIKPGGLYVLDLVLSEPRRQPLIGEEWVRRRSGYRVGLSLRGYDLDPHRQVERVLFTIRARRGDRELSAQGQEEMRLITPHELRALATRRGLFEVLAVYGPRWDIRDQRHLLDEPGRRVVVLKRTDLPVPAPISASAVPSGTPNQPIRSGEPRRSSGPPTRWPSGEDL